MAASMAMCLRSIGFDTDEDEVNKVMGARPMQGAAWEEALASAQHYGCRATLTVPATVNQLRNWTDQGIPVMIAWNPEGRDWSHASVVYDVTEGLPETIPSSCVVQGDQPGRYIWVADPNIPNPDKTTRIVHEDLFYSKWYEKWPKYLVRRPACAIDREVTPQGRQVVASTNRVPDDVKSFFGMPPFDVGSNIVFLDGYFFRSLRLRHHVKDPDELAEKFGISKAERDRAYRNMQDVYWKSANETEKDSVMAKRDKIKIKKEDLPKPRHGPEYVDQVQRRPGAGKHHTRTRDVETGRSRKPKHRQNYRDMAASASRVAHRFLNSKDED